jgi:hypothetical protein
MQIQKDPRWYHVVNYKNHVKKVEMQVRMHWLNVRNMTIRAELIENGRNFPFNGAT